MSKTLKHQIVEKARALIEDDRHWCRGELRPLHGSATLVNVNVRGHAAVLALLDEVVPHPADFASA